MTTHGRSGTTSTSPVGWSSSTGAVDGGAIDPIVAHDDAIAGVRGHGASARLGRDRPGPRAVGRLTPAAIRSGRYGRRQPPARPLVAGADRHPAGPRHAALAAHPAGRL